MLPTSALWTRNRPRGLDKRSRVYRKWARVRERLVAELGREPKAGENDLLDGLTDAILELELLRARRHKGEPIAHDDLRRFVSEIRRIRFTLGLSQRIAEPMQEEQELGGLMA